VADSIQDREKSLTFGEGFWAPGAVGAVLLLIAAITLALIGGAYIGFDRAAGLLWTPLALPVGLAAHAAWDLLHHNDVFGAPVTRWYISFCVVFELLAAAFLFVLYVP